MDLGLDWTDLDLDWTDLDLDWTDLDLDCILTSIHYTKTGEAGMHMPALMPQPGLRARRPRPAECCGRA